MRANPVRTPNLATEDPEPRYVRVLDFFGEPNAG